MANNKSWRQILANRARELTKTEEEIDFRDRILAEAYLRRGKLIRRLRKRIKAQSESHSRLIEAASGIVSKCDEIEDAIYRRDSQSISEFREAKRILGELL